MTAGSLVAEVRVMGVARRFALKLVISVMDELPGRHQKVARPRGPCNCDWTVPGEGYVDVYCASWADFEDTLH